MEEEEDEEEEEERGSIEDVGDLIVAQRRPPLEPLLHPMVNYCLQLRFTV